MLPGKLKDYIKEGAEIFVFARGSERDKIETLVGKVHSTYINENNFPINAYYPIMEIVTITLAQFMDGQTIKQIPCALDKLNIKSVIENDGTLIFTLLPKAKQYDTRDLIKQYSILKKLLESA